MNPRREKLIMAVVCLSVVMGCASGPSFEGFPALPPQEILGPLVEEFEAKIEALRTQGAPTTIAELELWYPPPPEGENAAVVYQEAFDHMVEITDKQYNLLPVVGKADTYLRTEPPPSKVKRAMEEYLAQNAETLRLLHRAAFMKHYRYPVEFVSAIEAGKCDPLLMLRLDYKMGMRQATRLLLLAAWRRFFDGDMDGVTDSLVTSLAIPRALAREPFIISQLTGWGCLGMSLDSLELMMDAGRYTDSQLARLGTALEGLVQEECFVRASMADKLIEQYLLPEFEEHMEAAFKARMDRSEKALIVFDLSRKTLIHMVIAAIAVERYRLANGALPATLDDVVPEYLDSVPMDPFVNAKIRYTKQGEGYAVWSVGDDGIPSQETHTRKARESPYRPDISFIVER